MCRRVDVKFLHERSEVTVLVLNMGAEVKHCGSFSSVVRELLRLVTPCESERPTTDWISEVGGVTVIHIWA